jgi:hypothetical protein
VLIYGENGGMKMPYSDLTKVLAQAYEQAACGKGRIRHGDQSKFTDQSIFWIEKHFSSFQLGQAIKKIHESQRLEYEEAEKELLGAIVYLAAHIIHLKGMRYAIRTNEEKCTDAFSGGGYCSGGINQQAASTETPRIYLSKGKRESDKDNSITGRKSDT